MELLLPLSCHLKAEILSKSRKKGSHLLTLTLKTKSLEDGEYSTKKVLSRQKPMCVRVPTCSNSILNILLESVTHTGVFCLALIQSTST